MTLKTPEKTIHRQKDQTTVTKPQKKAKRRKRRTRRKISELNLLKSK